MADLVETACEAGDDIEWRESRRKHAVHYRVLLLLEANLHKRLEDKNRIRDDDICAVEVSVYFSSYMGLKRTIFTLDERHERCQTLLGGFRHNTCDVADGLY